MRRCDNHPETDAAHELSVYERPSLIIVWRGTICADCLDKTRDLIKRGEGSHLLLILPLKWPRRVAVV